MNGSMHRRRLATDILHNINLTAPGPTDFIDIFAEHPKCRPHTLPRRNLDARFEPAICLLEIADSFYAGRAILAPTIPAPFLAGEGFFDGCDHQVPISIH